MKRFCLVGTQGTGKSTILHEYEDSGIELITEVVRNLSKKGVKINEQGDEESQDTIFSEYILLLSQQCDYISDRGLVDVIAYSSYLADKGSISKKIVSEQLEQLKTFNKLNPDIIYCYFPIEFPVVDDGVRSTNEEFRKSVDKYILSIFEKCNINYITIKGSVKERKEIIDNLLK